MFLLVRMEVRNLANGYADNYALAAAVVAALFTALGGFAQRLFGKRARKARVDKD
ncbi:MAG: hypothetical protein HC850_09675 [Rhodomicrobium sp.]|nr:hypothetical protein [Rhodomicrobium sp.]